MNKKIPNSTEHVHLTVSPKIKALAKQHADSLFGGNISALFAYLVLQAKEKEDGNITSNDISSIVDESAFKKMNTDAIKNVQRKLGRVKNPTK